MFQLCIIFVRYNLGVYEKIRVDLGKASKLTVSINFFQLPTVLVHRKCIQKQKLKQEANDAFKSFENSQKSGQDTSKKL